MGRRDLIRLQEALTSGEVGYHLPTPKINCDGSAQGGASLSLNILVQEGGGAVSGVSDGCSLLLAAAGVPPDRGDLQSQQMKPKAQSTVGHCLLAL